MACCRDSVWTAIMRKNVETLGDTLHGSLGTSPIQLAFRCIYSLSLVSMAFPCGSAGKESACNEGDLGSIPGLGRYPGEGKGNPLQYSGLENSMDCIVHGVAKSRTWLRDFHFTLVSISHPSPRSTPLHPALGSPRRPEWLQQCPVRWFSGLTSIYTWGLRERF